MSHVQLSTQWFKRLCVLAGVMVLGSAESVMAQSFDFCDFGIYSSQESRISDNTIVQGGPIGSAGHVDVGVNSDVYGDIESGGDVSLRNYSYVDGNVSASGAIHEQLGAVSIVDCRLRMRYTCDMLSTCPR